MGEKKTPQRTHHEEVIAAFDRERDRAHELNRKHAEQVRAMRADDKALFIERRRQPR